MRDGAVCHSLNNASIIIVPSFVRNDDIVYYDYYASYILHTSCESSAIKSYSKVQSAYHFFEALLYVPTRVYLNNRYSVLTTQFFLNHKFILIWNFGILAHIFYSTLEDDNTYYKLKYSGNFNSNESQFWRQYTLLRSIDNIICIIVVFKFI